MTLMVPCPHCADGFTSHGDRHARTRMDVCSACGGTHRVRAATGESREASFDPGAAHASDSPATSDRTPRDQGERS